jgi:hypothetical protein
LVNKLQCKQIIDIIMYYKIIIKKLKIEIIMKIIAQKKENKIWLKKELIKLDRKRKL